MERQGLPLTEILNYLPQQKPFRFVDEVTSVNTECISGHYTFRKDEFFYAGHFPVKPITPGVILLESMCQLGGVAFGIYLFSLNADPDELKNFLVAFTDSQLEIIKPVYPEQKVIINAEKLIWRRMRMRSKVEMCNMEGDLVATAIISGLGVSRS